MWVSDNHGLLICTLGGRSLVDEHVRFVKREDKIFLEASQTIPSFTGKTRRYHHVEVDLTKENLAQIRDWVDAVLKSLEGGSQ